MSNLTNDFEDTDSIVYSHIDRLTKIIEITLEKGQIKNAEDYLKYFFETFVNISYKIATKNSNQNHSKESKSAVVIATEDKNANFPNFKALLAQRKIQTRAGDWKEYFNSKINKLLSSNIKAERYEIFHFILGLYTSSILSLVKNPKTFFIGNSMIYNLKFSAGKILNIKKNLSVYEKSWYEHALFEWFIEFYTRAEFDSNNIPVIEIEILFIFKIIIDTNDVGIFNQFLNRISSSIIDYNSFFRKDLNEFKFNEREKDWKIDRLINKYINKNNSLSSPVKFDNRLKDQSDELFSELETLGFPENKANEFIAILKSSLFGDFKKRYIKVILAKIIVYSFFKRNPDFFKIYISYHQPSDADAIHIGENYNITRVEEIQYFLLNISDINNQYFFWEGHHGFTVYIYTFIAYYLYKFKRNNNNVSLNTNNRQEAIVIQYYLEEVQKKADRNILKEIINNFDQKNFDDIIVEYVSNAKKQTELITHNETVKADISESITERFIVAFMKAFDKATDIRSILTLNNLIAKVDEENGSKILGFDQYLNKEIFVDKPNGVFLNVPDSFAEELARIEDINLMVEIEKACERKKLTNKEWIDFLLNNKQNYDLLLSKGKYISEYDFPSMNYVEAFTINTNLYKTIPDFEGILDSHYNVFYLRRFPFEEYVLLNSKRIGEIIQYKPPILENGKVKDNFSFSFIDFKKDPESLRKHLANDESNTEDVLLENVWFRALESVGFKAAKDFIGVVIEIIEK